MSVVFLKNMIELSGPKSVSFLLASVSVLSVTALSFFRSPYFANKPLLVLFYIVFIAALGFLSFYLIRHRRFYIALFSSIAATLCYVWLVLLLFGEDYGIHFIYPLIAVILAELAGGSYRYLVLERDAHELRAVHYDFLEGKQVAYPQNGPGSFRIGGDSREVTIIFTDIKGFSTFSEKHTPQEVVYRLNEYLGEMVQVIEEYDGYVDKFIGDGIMAYWGAPVAQADHAKRALSCVLAMQQTMARLCVKWTVEGLEPFSIRAGVQSGEVVAGNLGLIGRKMEYTVIGDTVNQAARLESSAKYYGVDILVGENTYMYTRDIFNFRELDKIRMAGKQVPVTVYELSDPRTMDQAGLNRLFADALTIYRTRQWEMAEKAFAAILAEFPLDRPSEMYLERCQYFIKNPVPATWDGVFNRRGK